MNRVRTSVGLVLIATLSGCQTPSAVHSLAEISSANASIFQNHLGEMANQSKTLASRRADHIASMDAFNAEFEGYIKRELYMREKSSTENEWSKTDGLMKQLTSLRDELIAIEAAAAMSRPERRKSILASQSDLNTYQTAMRDTANALNALAKQENTSERAAFLKKFILDVRNHVRETLKNDDLASKSAKKLVDEIKQDLKIKEEGETNAQ